MKLNIGLAIYHCKTHTNRHSHLWLKTLYPWKLVSYLENTEWKLISKTLPIFKSFTTIPWFIALSCFKWTVFIVSSPLSAGTENKFLNNWCLGGMITFALRGGMLHFGGKQLPEGTSISPTFLGKIFPKIGNKTTEYTIQYTIFI